jgi:hypothetical protein
LEIGEARVSGPPTVAGLLCAPDCSSLACCVVLCNRGKPARSPPPSTPTRRRQPVLVQLVVRAVLHARGDGGVGPLDGLLRTRPARQRQRQRRRLASAAPPAAGAPLRQALPPALQERSQPASQPAWLRRACSHAHSQPAASPPASWSPTSSPRPCRRGRRWSGRIRGRWSSGSSSASPPGCSLGGRVRTGEGGGEGCLSHSGRAAGSGRRQQSCALGGAGGRAAMRLRQQQRRQRAQARPPHLCSRRWPRWR